MSQYLTKEEKTEKLLKRVEEIYTRKEVAMFLGIYPTSDIDALRDAATRRDGKPSPLELVLKKRGLRS